MSDRPAPSSATQTGPQPMDPQRLNELRFYAHGRGRQASWIQDADGRDIVTDLLADRDRLSAERDSARQIAEYWRDLVCDDFGGCSIDARLDWEPIEPSGAADS